jgi:CheY-like chemotaxis protein
MPPLSQRRNQNERQGRNPPQKKYKKKKTRKLLKLRNKYYPEENYRRVGMTKVMLVEDDPVMVNLLETFLQIEGFEVAALSHDGDVLASIKENNPDVILLDVHLKMRGIDINGFDLLEQIRETNQLSDSKIIMSSGMDVRERCDKVGTDGFLLKPYMPDDLIRLIKKVTGN